ncbi:energy-coupling factor transporter transmembrane protein EcfT [Paenarthrobacter sp. Z7-10]|uniref:energy-coupling factor transporter transmembrane component T family protein n=1 Tax=Paenarthrobacter sp. Z7-10 TaxID=2787635 RepID=UPI0022A96490|nr:energy-coupling factor transporter transmembrane component T [Paenarthrobacter sp. Z7-10]MCZ2405052.1 energy-coupling factor transporter transmembrane protein EcfT [Paenarthrobacter sp. Z7-10]
MVSAAPPRLGRLSPLTVLCAAVVIAVTTTALNSWAVSAGVLLGLAVLLASVGLGRKVLPAAAVIMVPFGLSLLLTHGLFFPEGRSVLWTFGPARVTAEGLFFAASMGLRTAVFVVVFLAFSFHVQPADLMALLTKYRTPPQLGFVLCSALTIAPAIAARARRVAQAQQARGLVTGSGLRGRLAAVREQAVPLVLALLHEAGSRADSLEARGFGGRSRRTSYREVTDSRAQQVFRTMLLAALLAFLVFWYGAR